MATYFFLRGSVFDVARHCSYFIFMVLFLVSSGSLHAQTLTPGKIPGEFTVTPSGAANYRIPIQVPPGVAGFEPNLVLSYSSQSSNGMMGMGWSLEGVSTITRCPKTLATDGVFGNINNDTNDRFCLDGQRLINVLGAYGASGSEYRTEIDTFSKVIANGAAAGNLANGPESFTVKTKDGLTMQYGQTTDSRIEVQGRSVIRLWVLNKMIDVKGNTIDFLYTKYAATGYYQLNTVAYAGNNALVFTYENRPDVNIVFEAGSPIQETMRLKKIETQISGNLVQRTTINYAANSSSFGSYIDTIQICSPTLCQQPLQLTWSDAGIANFSLSGSGNWNGTSNPVANTVSGDFNGDGKTDLLNFVASDQWKVCLATGIGFSCSNWTGHWGGLEQNVMGDFNGDGKTDIAAYAGGSNWVICLSTGTNFSCTYQAAHSNGIANNVTGDFNGDGRTDLMGFVGSNLWNVCLSTGTGFSCSNWTGHWGGMDHNTVGDFNGDGKTDIAAYAGGTNWVICSSTGVNFSCNYWSGHDGGEANNVLGDFNGDGKTDLMKFVASDQWNVCLSTGTGFTCKNWTAHWGGLDHNTTGDFNGDGKTDIAAYAGGANWVICLSTGTNFSCSYWTGNEKDEKNNIVGDFNGDGVTDLAGYTTGTAWKVVLSAKKSAMAVAKFAPAPGHENNVTYSILSRYSSENPSPYTKGNSAIYPLSDLNIPMQVVASSSASNGVNGVNTTNYTYGNLVSEQASSQYPGSGRGMLGFGWMRSKSVQTGMEVYTEFAQTWPFTGLVGKSETRYPYGGQNMLIKQTINTVGCNQSHAAVGTPAVVTPIDGCRPWVPGKAYQPYIIQSLENSWDANGVPMPSIFTENLFMGVPDQNGALKQFGSPTRLQVDITQAGVLKQRKITTNEYLPAKTAGNDWQLGRLKKATVTSTTY